MVHKLYIRIVDVVHPGSGEVLAECGGVLDMETPRERHVLSVAKDYPEHYVAIRGARGSTVIAPTYGEAASALEMIEVLKLVESGEI